MTGSAFPVPQSLHVAQKRGRYPNLPPGWGAVEITFNFDSMVALESAGRHIMDCPNWGNWIDSPTITIDGNERRAGWSVWAYTLPAGPHELRFRTPGYAQRRIEITARKVCRLAYDAEIVLHKSQADDTLAGPVRETTAAVKVRTLTRRSI